MAASGSVASVGSIEQKYEDDALLEECFDICSTVFAVEAVSGCSFRCLKLGFKRFIEEAKKTTKTKKPTTTHTMP